MRQCGEEIRRDGIYVCSVRENGSLCLSSSLREGCPRCETFRRRCSSVLVVRRSTWLKKQCPDVRTALRVADRVPAMRRRKGQSAPFRP
ncbi:hypothetical protein MTO96_013378 [Rhipicephalus appendiculatus]